MKVSAVVFDLYGTLLDYGSLAAHWNGAVPDPAAFVAAWRTKQLAYAMAATLMDRYIDFDDVTARSYAYVADLFGAPSDGGARREAVAQWARLPAYPDVSATLATLHARSVPACVLSNGTPAGLAATLAGAGIAERFMHVLSVDAVRAFKPHTSVYAYAEREIGAPRERIAFVSSNGWDATGAAEFGFHVVWCNRGALPAETMGAKPAATIAMLSELPGALES